MQSATLYVADEQLAVRASIARLDRLTSGDGPALSNTALRLTMFAPTNDAFNAVQLS